jgi:hypothetical protein
MIISHISGYKDTNKIERLRKKFRENKKEAGKNASLFSDREEENPSRKVFPVKD